jgi:thiol-disulfide isomerase/thioredoxin
MVGGGVPEAVQKLVGDLEKIDKALVVAKTPVEFKRLNVERADIIEQIIAGVTDPEDRILWTKQYAETVSASVQAGQFADGIKLLEKLLLQVESGGDKNLISFVKFRYMSSKYNFEVQDPNAPFQKLHGAWLADLEKFVTDFAGTEEAPDAMLQLAMGHEFADEEKLAIKWYGQIVSDYPQHLAVKKAAGAKRRLESVGQTMVLKGGTFDRKAFDLAALKGKVVLVQYWATWCEPCKQDMDTIKQLQAKYAKAGFQPVGVNLDSSAADAVAFLKAKQLPWPSLYDEGGLESRLANEMGILTLPTMLLIDKNGRVVNRNINAAELDKELGKLLK